ncbi:MAG: hypothetical protein R2731_02605 [Nocardioides sp.]
MEQQVGSTVRHRLVGELGEIKPRTEWNTAGGSVVVRRACQRREAVQVDGRDDDVGRVLAGGGDHALDATAPHKQVGDRRQVHTVAAGSQSRRERGADGGHSARGPSTHRSAE